MTDPADDPDPPCIRSIRGTRCPLCSSGKFTGRTFCDECFAAVGPSDRAALCCSADAYPAALAGVFQRLGREMRWEE